MADAVMSYHRFYDFRIDGDVVGYFEIEATPSSIYQRARFVVDDSIVDNRYHLRLEDGSVTGFSTGDDAIWTSLDTYASEAYPLSSFPLLLDRLDGELTYLPIDESTGEVGPRRVLQREGATVIERRDGRMTRSFTVQEGILTSIDWGGATSVLQPDRERAVARGPFE